MLSVAEAQQMILATVSRLEPEPVFLLDALGRVLAQDVYADSALPPFDNSAMDGYAIRAEDVAHTSRANAVRLPVIGEVPAGHPTDLELRAGTAMRITTGALLPRGADAVVPVEDTDDGARGAGALPETVIIYTAFGH